jgi:hypothetical protein
MMALRWRRVDSSLLSSGSANETRQVVLALSSCVDEVGDVDKVNHFGRCPFLHHIGSRTKNVAWI